MNKVGEEQLHEILRTPAANRAVDKLIDHIEALTAELLESRAENARLRAIVETPIKLPKINHPAQFDYIDKLEPMLREYGLTVAGDE